jgi:sugar O-acyltransferase (sialic acid O-acetyltransferase NeuD family)
MTAKLAFVGFGDLGRQIHDMVLEEEPATPSEIAIFDDSVKNAHPFAAYEDDAFASAKFFVCLGYHHLPLKRTIMDQLSARGRRMPSFVHPRAFVHASVKLGEGVIVYAGSVIDRNCVIGRGTLLNNSDVIAHDTKIGDASWLGPGVTLSGKVSIGHCAFLGSGTTVSNGISIGDNAIIGLATAVTRDVLSAQSVIGNPMRVLPKPLKLT